YADDTTIIAHTADSLSMKLRVLELYCKENKLRVNVNKTKIMVFSKHGRMGYTREWRYMGESIENVKTFTYLGIPFQSNGSFKKTAQAALSRGKVALSASWGLICGKTVDSWQTRMKLYRAIVQSVPLYGASLWGLQHTEILERLNQHFAKSLLQLPTYTPGYLLRIETGQLHASFNISKITLQFWIRILTMHDTRLPKRCYLQLMETPGSWPLQIKQLLDHHGYSFVWNLQDPLISKYLLPIIMQT
ncbi:unnamed protein product, partial [Allacma fusca]